MKFRTKPVVIEAMQWPEEGRREYESVCQRANIHRWVNGNGGKTTVVYEASDVYAAIVTLEGKMRISSGDWVIRGVKGEFYPCKADIFEATYEPVEDE